MDGKDIQSDLHALKRLYGLLRKDGGEASGTSDSLDAPVRIFLKNLLDLATKRVLKTHSEVIAGQAKASGAHSPARLQQLDEAAFEERPTPRSRLSIAVEGDQSSDATEQSIHRVPSVGLRHGQKRCRVCQKNTVKQLGSTGETHFHDVAQNSNTYFDHQYQQIKVGNCNKEIGWLSSKMSDDSKCEKWMERPSDLNIIGDADISKLFRSNMETISEPEETDCLSQEASKAIQQIELCMSALRMGADDLHLFENTSSTQQQNHVPETESSMQTKYNSVRIGTSLGENQMTRNNLLCEISGQRVMDDSVYPMHQVPRTTPEAGDQPHFSSSQRHKAAQPAKAVFMQSRNNIIQSEPVSHADVLDVSEESTDRCRFPTQKVNKIYVQNMNAIVEKIEPGNWIVSSTSCVPNGISLIPSQTSYITPSRPASNMESPYQSRTVVEDEQSKPFSFTNPKHHPPLKNKKTAHLLPSSGFHGNQSDAQNKVGFGKDRRYTTALRTSLQNQESDSTATDSYSSWSSQQTSSRGSNSEDYSVTDGSEELQNVTGSKSSRSWDTSLSHGSGSQHSHYRSYSEEEVYSLSSGDGAREVSSSSSSTGRKGYSSYEQPIRKQSTSKKPGASRVGKAYGVNLKKQSGILKRLKDRVAVVFHHHHHHHHHHHKRGNDESSSSMEKHKGKVAASPKRQEEAHGGTKAVEKMGKSKIREKSQQSHFRGLVGGLVRHVKQSKQRGKGSSEHGRKKSQSHWWKLLQHHQTSKLHHKAHLKLGLGKKKARLKALPKIE